VHPGCGAGALDHRLEQGDAARERSAVSREDRACGVPRALALVGVGQQPRPVPPELGASLTIAP